jgi:hypothetical protein
MFDRFRRYQGYRDDSERVAATQPESQPTAEVQLYELTGEDRVAAVRQRIRRVEAEIFDLWLTDLEVSSAGEGSELDKAVARRAALKDLLESLT